MLNLWFFFFRLIRFRPILSRLNGLKVRLLTSETKLVCECVYVRGEVGLNVFFFVLFDEQIKLCACRF